MAATTPTILTADIELTPDRLEYIAANRVRVVLKTGDGETVSYVMKTGMLMRSLTMSVDLLNSRKVEFLRDLRML